MERQALIPSVQVELTEREQYALQKFIEKRDPSISPHTATRLFELFLAGNDLETIRKSDGRWTLGQLVAARIDGQWDKMLQEHREALYKGAKEKIEQVALETALTLTNLLSAKNKLYMSKVTKYLQDGDEAHLADIGLGGVDGYRKLIEALQKVTGTEPSQKVKGEVVHTIGSTKSADGKTKVSGEQAAQIINLLLQDHKVE